MSARQTTHSGELPTWAARADITSYKAPQWGQKNFPADRIFHSRAMVAPPVVRSAAVGSASAIMYYVYQVFPEKKRAPATGTERRTRHRRRVPKRGSASPDAREGPESGAHIANQPCVTTDRPRLSAVRPLRPGYRQGRVGTVQELDRGEHQLGIADVLEIVHLALACPVGLMPRLAGPIAVLDRRAVLQMLPPASRRDRRPEIIEDMAVQSDPFAGLQPDRPHADAVALG